MSTVRVRFAPSPTGYLHVGGLRTALYNYLYARKNNGRFILRIEDTDRARYVEGAVENLVRTLEWAGLDFDEGPGKGGIAAPYVQSERLALYRQYAMQLLGEGKAYYAFDTAEELAAMRARQEKTGASPKYDRSALKLTPDDVRRKLDAGIAAVIRMKVPDGVTVAFDDIVRGRVEFASELIDDQVLLKSDGYPTYHLANVVDDHLMGVTHVVRGEEWLSSTPKHVLLYQFFGWELPRFAHLPLLLNPDKSKLSKRQGDVAVEDYRQKGYLPESLVNFVALLGWNPGTDQEVFSMEELIRQFSLERVGKSGAVFNIDKLNWLNAQHLRARTDDELVALVRAYDEGTGMTLHGVADAYLRRVVAVMRERAVFASDFVEKCRYFYQAPETYDAETLAKRWKTETARHLRAYADELSRLTSTEPGDFEAALNRTVEAVQVKKGDLIHPLRLAVSGTNAGPGLYDLMAILGRDETVRRIGVALERIRT